MKLSIVIKAVVISIFLSTSAIAYNTEDSFAVDENENQLKSGHKRTRGQLSILHLATDPI